MDTKFASVAGQANNPQRLSARNAIDLIQDTTKCLVSAFHKAIRVPVSASTLRLGTSLPYSTNIPALS